MIKGVFSRSTHLLALILALSIWRTGSAVYRIIRGIRLRSLPLRTVLLLVCLLL